MVHFLHTCKGRVSKMQHATPHLSVCARKLQHTPRHACIAEDGMHAKVVVPQQHEALLAGCQLGVLLHQTALLGGLVQHVTAHTMLVRQLNELHVKT